MPPAAASADRVIVLGIDTQIGLALIRELRAHGVEVYGVGSSAEAVGLYSRDLHHGSVCPRESGARLAHLRELSRRHDISFLMAVSEPDLIWLNQYRASLPDLKLLIPTTDKLARVLDKEKVYQLAREVGIDTPRAVEPGSFEEIVALAPTLEFPVVLKWARQNEIMPLLQPHRLRFDKYRYCYDARELLATLEPFQKVGRYPLIQSYCPGVGLGQMIFMFEGEPRLRFQHLRVHECPPEGGASSLSESRPLDSELLERSVELLRRIEWTGPAMVEFRYDPATRRAALMEINGRFWGSLPLAHHAGAHFGWYTYAMLGKGHDPQQTNYRFGVRCMHASPELKRLATILFRPEAIQNKSLRFGKGTALLEFARAIADPRTTFYIFSWRDPRPALMDAWFALRRAGRGAWKSATAKFARSSSRGHGSPRKN